MKDYALFSVNDFVMDEYFQSWVLQPDESKNSYWLAWLDENPDKASEVDAARAVIQQINFSTHKLSSEEVSSLWNSIKTGNEENKRSRSVSLYWYASAAAVLLVGVLMFYWVQHSSFIEYETAFGETRTVILPDNSRVILNSNSSLRLASNWDNNSPREVLLDGEAFFSVTHTKNHQLFRVKTSEGVGIEVLGTTFNVYHRTANTKVVLNTGKIRLSLPKADKKIMMKPGDLIEYNDKKKYTYRAVDPKMYTSWTENNLILNRTTLREMVAMLKDNYGVDIEVADELLNQTVSGSMPLTNADELLLQVAKAFQLKVIHDGDKIILTE